MTYCTCTRPASDGTLSVAADQDACRGDRLKSALVDAVTHELRTPITSIKASTTALLREDEGFDSAARHELLEIVDQETDRLNDLVEDLVGAARIESRSFTLDRSWIAPEDVIADAVSRVALRLHGQKVDVRVPETIPGVFADARALSEIIFQLLQNAVKYSPREQHHQRIRRCPRRRDRRDTCRRCRAWRARDRAGACLRQVLPRP